MSYEKSQNKGTKSQIILEVGEGKGNKKLTSMDMKTIFGLIDILHVDCDGVSITMYVSKFIDLCSKL